MAGRASKMPITRSTRAEIGRNTDHRMRIYELYISVLRKNSLKTPAAPENRDLLHFLASVAQNILQALGPPFPSEAGVKKEKPVERGMGMSVYMSCHTQVHTHDACACPQSFTRQVSSG